jgi:K+-transporting ATPase KdpF subunit
MRHGRMEATGEIHFTTILFYCNLIKIKKMKPKIPKLYMSLVVVPVHSVTVVSNDPISYIMGGIVALFILGYLIYTLLKPEKF